MPKEPFPAGKCTLLPEREVSNYCPMWNFLRMVLRGTSSASLQQKVLCRTPIGLGACDMIKDPPNLPFTKQFFNLETNTAIVIFFKVLYY